MSPAKKAKQTLISPLYIAGAVIVALLLIIISFQVVSEKQLKTTVIGPSVSPSPFGNCCRPAGSKLFSVYGSATGYGTTQARAKADAKNNGAASSLGSLCADSDTVKAEAKKRGMSCNPGGLCEAKGDPVGRFRSADYDNRTSPICTFTPPSTGGGSSGGGSNLWTAICKFKGTCQITLDCKEKKQPSPRPDGPNPECGPTTAEFYASRINVVGDPVAYDPGYMGYGKEKAKEEAEANALEKAEEHFSNYCDGVIPPFLQCHAGNCKKTTVHNPGSTGEMNSSVTCGYMGGEPGYFYVDVAPVPRKNEYQATVVCAFASCICQQECEEYESPSPMISSPDPGQQSSSGGGFSYSGSEPEPESPSDYMISE